MKKRTHIQSPSFFIGLHGNGLVSFGSGQPDLPPSIKVMNVRPSKQSFQYGLIAGIERLRKRLVLQYPHASYEDFVITNGASEALDLVFRAISRRSAKKRVLLPIPYYYSYPYIVRFAGLTPVYTKLKEGKIDIVDFKKKIKHCAAALINSPSNPTGRVESIETLKQVEKITQRAGVYVVSDEVYKDLIYERENYLIKGPHVVTVNSFSKTFSMCGLRIGYLFSKDKGLVREVREMKTHTSMNTNMLAQERALAATTVPKSFLRGQVQIWKERRDILCEGLKKIGFDLWKPEGAFYVFPRVKNGNKVVNDLFYNYRVIVYDGAWFGCPERIRLSYALDKAKMKEGLSRIHDYVRHHDIL